MKKGYFEAPKMNGRFITFDFILSSVISLVLRLFLDWPIVILIIIVAAFFRELLISLKHKVKFSSGQILIYLIASSMVLAIMEYFYLIKK